MKMRNIFRVMLAACLLSLSIPAMSNVVVESSCDSIAMWIGEQCGVHLSVTCDAGQKVIFPAFQETIAENLEIIPPVVTDTQYIDKKKRMTVTRSYTVTSFDSAFFYIPPFEVLVDSMPYRAEKGISLAVYMFDVDTLNTDQFFGPKDIMDQPVEWTDLKLSVYFLLIFAALLAVAIFLFISWKNDKPVIRIIKVEPKKPAHEVAIAEIERIRQSQISHGEDAKQYYTELTDAVRVYMNERFGFNATEMTSDEIIECLLEVRDKESIEELKELFTTSDLVKFAKLKPMLGENDRNLLTAMEFVKQTMSQEESEEEKPEEQVVVESKRSKEARIMLLVSVAVLAAASCFFLFRFCKEIYYLFF